MKRTVGAALVLVILAGCNTGPPRPTYAEQVLNRPLPQTDRERERECASLRDEIARQQNLAQVGQTMATTPLMAVAMQAMARKNIAALEARAANVQCTAAFSSAPSDGEQTFDQCFSHCKQYTSRSDAQCFDACNK